MGTPSPICPSVPRGAKRGETSPSFVGCDPYRSAQRLTRCYVFNCLSPLYTVWRESQVGLTGGWVGIATNGALTQPPPSASPLRNSPSVPTRRAFPSALVHAKEQRSCHPKLPASQARMMHIDQCFTPTPPLPIVTHVTDWLASSAQSQSSASSLSRATTARSSRRSNIVSRQDAAEIRETIEPLLVTTSLKPVPLSPTTSAV